MDPEEKHMIERLSNPTPRTLRCQSRGYSSGYNSPCSTLGSLKSQQQYTRRPPDEMVSRAPAHRRRRRRDWP